MSAGHLVASIGNAKAHAMGAFKNGSAPAPRFVIVSPSTARLFGCTHVHGLEVLPHEGLADSEFAILGSRPAPNIELNRTAPANMAVARAVHRRRGSRALV